MKDSLPELLQNTLARAREQVTGSADRNLSPHTRESVYRAIGAFHNPRADAVRGWLGLFAARNVLPYWKVVWPDDQLADDSLELAEGVLRGVVDPRLALARASAIWDHFTSLKDLVSQKELVRKPGYPGSLFAGIAAVTAIEEAAGMHAFCGTAPWVQESDTDEELFDAESGDVALWASRAHAGRVHDRSSSPHQREEYWLWWLDEALPRSWYSPL